MDSEDGGGGENGKENLGAGFTSFSFTGSQAKWLSAIQLYPKKPLTLGDDERSTQVLVCLFVSGWWETKHSQTPDFLQVINTVRNSTSDTGKCFLLLFKVTPDADALSTQRK